MNLKFTKVLYIQKVKDTGELTNRNLFT